MVAFIGLAPKEAIQGSSIKKKPRRCKIGHARLRKALYLPAPVSIRYNPMIVTFYRRLKNKGKSGKVIVCAVMGKLVHIIFGILKSGKPFDPNITPHFSRIEQQYLRMSNLGVQLEVKTTDWYP